MSTKTNESIVPHESLERAFHSPARTAIMAAVCAGGKKGATFTELKNACNLTDGNLGAHLTALVDFGAVRVLKTPAGLKTLTTIYATKKGLNGFTDYLDTLQAVLKSAKAAVASSARDRVVAARTARA